MLRFMNFQQLFKKNGMLSVMSDNDTAAITKPRSPAADDMS